MTDYNQSDWAELDANNTGVSPNGVQGGYAPSQVAPILRAMRGAAKRDFVRSNPIYTTTGTSNAYVLTYEGAPTAYTTGAIYRFMADRANTGAATLNINGLGAKSIIMPDGSALTASQIKANRVIEAYYNGTSFVMIGYVDQNLKLGDVSANTLTLTAALSIASGGTGANTAPAALASLGADNASNIILGTLADARLPTSMAGKTFTSLITSSAGGEVLRLAGDGTTTADPFITFYKAGDRQAFIQHLDGTADGEGFRLVNDLTDDSLYLSNVNSINALKWLDSSTGLHNTIWHSGNDGAGSGLDADLLDGQQGSYYLAASSYTAADVLTKIKTVDGAGSGLDADLLDGQSSAYYLDVGNATGTLASARLSGTYNINISGSAGSASSASSATLATKASTLSRDGGNGSAMTFNWSGQGGQPSWLWGGNDATNMYVWNPSNFSVNYANTAGSAPANGGTATNSNQLGGINAASWLQRADMGQLYADLGHNSIGSVAMLKRIGGGTFTQGTTSLGSLLEYCSTTGSPSGSNPSGTWACQGRADATNAATVWKRIS